MVVGCGWCDRLNTLDVEHCPGCGHDAQCSPRHCRCDRCRRLLAVGAAIVDRDPGDENGATA